MQEAIQADQVRAVIDSTYTEAEFQAQVITLAEGLGWRVAHFHDSRRQVGDKMVGDAQAKGFPDLVMVRDGQMVIAELKTEKGRMSAAQKDWQKDLNNVAIVAFEAVSYWVWRPRDWEHIETVLA